MFLGYYIFGIIKLATFIIKIYSAKRRTLPFKPSLWYVEFVLKQRLKKSAFPLLKTRC